MGAIMKIARYCGNDLTHKKEIKYMNLGISKAVLLLKDDSKME